MKEHASAEEVMVPTAILILLGFWAFILAGGYFAVRKVQNDASIAKDTKRAADALERMAGKQ